MNRFTKIALIAASAALATQAAHAQGFNNGDIVLGFTEASAANDYIMELGSYQSVGVGGSSVVNLSSIFSSGQGANTFNSDFSGGLSGVSVGAAGGYNGSLSTTINFETVLRTSNFGTPSVAGSTAPGSYVRTVGSSGLGILGGMVNGINTYGQSLATPYSFGAGQSVSVAHAGVGTTASSWNNNVDSFTPPTSSWATSTGHEVDSAASGSVIVEDLWGAKISSGSYVFNQYEGYFTIDTSGASPSLTFTPSAVAVPEPASYGLMAGAGLLLVSLRRQLARKSA